MPDIDEELLGPSDKYGPLAAEDTEQFDPLLDLLGDFTMKVINAISAQSWTKKWGHPPIREVFINDPKTGSFVDSSLPALYIFRSKIGSSIWKAADWIIRPSTLTLRLVLPPMQQEHRADLSNFINLYASALDIAVERGRHPAWRYKDDTDARSARLGSPLYEYAGLYKLEVGDTRPGTLELRMADAPPMSFDTIDSSYEAVEKIEPDITRYPENGGLQVRVTTETDNDNDPLTLGAQLFDDD